MHPILKSYRERQRTYYNRAERVVNALPEFPWEIKIDFWGHVSLDYEDTNGAKKALEEAGGRPLCSSDWIYWFNNEIVYLRHD